MCSTSLLRHRVHCVHLSGSQQSEHGIMIHFKLKKNIIQRHLSCIQPLHHSTSQSNLSLSVIRVLLKKTGDLICCKLKAVSSPPIAREVGKKYGGAFNCPAETKISYSKERFSVSGPLNHTRHCREASIIPSLSTCLASASPCHLYKKPGSDRGLTSWGAGDLNHLSVNSDTAERDSGRLWKGEACVASLYFHLPSYHISFIHLYICSFFFPFPSHSLWWTDDGAIS